VSKFFERTEDNVIMAHESAVNWYTAVYIKPFLDELKFLRNYQSIDKTLSDRYWKLDKFVKHYHSDISRYTANKFGFNSKWFQEMQTRWTKMQELQLFVYENSDKPEAIAAKAQQLALPTGTKDALIINIEMYTILQELLEYAAPIKALLNHVDLLIDKNEKKPQSPRDTEILIREMLESKDIIDYGAKLAKADAEKRAAEKAAEDRNLASEESKDKVEAEGNLSPVQ
jgi:hypothetical protein